MCKRKAELPSLYLLGMPGDIGGAATKISHLIRLLHRHFQITVVPSKPGFGTRKALKRFTESYGVPVRLLKDLPKKLEGVALGVCEQHLFSSGTAREVKARGLKLVWSNEMMWAFKGEREAAKAGLVDRVLFVSEFQAKAFQEIYVGVPSIIVGNYVDPDDFAWQERQHPVFTLGRLSRPDPGKYPLDFPVFYEELRIPEVRFRIMAWNHEIAKQYRWHKFGPEWELLAENRESAATFLRSLDVFLYPLGHRVKESWGRAVVEAMLTGCVPVVPSGHQFENLVVHGESGFVCLNFDDYQTCVRELYQDYSFRVNLSRQCSEHARQTLCNPDQHRQRWIEALTL